MREKYEAQANREFPSPLEVDRFISLEEAVKLRKAYNKFPSPLEVNRVISQVFQKPIILTLKFPSPLEVDRVISTVYTRFNIANAV